MTESDGVWVHVAGERSWAECDGVQLQVVEERRG